MDFSDFKRQLRQAANANRRLVGGTLVTLALFFYIWPWMRRHPVATACVNEKLAEYDPYNRRSQLHFLQLYGHGVDYGTMQHYTDDSEPTDMVPFVGNGLIGVSLYGNEAGYLRGTVDGLESRSLKIATKVQPLITATIPSLTKQADAFVVDYATATATKVSCFDTNAQVHNCAVITSKVYAHRKYPNLLVQTISVHNPLDRSVEVILERPNAQCTTTRQLGNHLLCISGDSYAALVLLLPSVKNKISIEARNKEDFRFLTFFEIANKDIERAKFDQEAASTLEQLLGRITKIDAGALDRQHIEIWQTLWHVGFHISHSFAPDTLNARAINATRYVVLSNTRAPLHESGVDGRQVTEARQALLKTELLYPSRLWSKLSTFEDIVDTAYVWRLTLEKRGCVEMLRAGADGIAQSMVLSFGALKFTHHHLEFNTHPQELHRDFDYSNVMYGNRTELSLSVRVGEDNKAQLWVSYKSLDGDKTKLYACDAGCLDPPIELPTEHYATFPVKLTKPVTPILYVTSDKKHLETLRHTIHVQEVNEAPAHEHHILALHRHGHRLGGLPTYFWVALGLLIVTFHLFLFKLIYNEYMRTPLVQGYRRANKFSM